MEANGQGHFVRCDPRWCSKGPKGSLPRLSITGDSNSIMRMHWMGSLRDYTETLYPVDSSPDQLASVCLNNTKVFLRKAITCPFVCEARATHVDLLRADASSSSEGLLWPT